MKYVAILLLSITLLGCGVVRDLNFEGNEVSILAKYRAYVEGTKSNCPNVPTALYKLYADHFYYMSEYSAGDNTKLLAKELKSLTDEFHGKKEFTESYCKFKLKNIETALDRIGVAMGNKIR